MLMQPSAMADTSRSPSFLRASMVTIAPCGKGREIRRGVARCQPSTVPQRRATNPALLSSFRRRKYRSCPVGQLRGERLVRGLGVDQRIDIELRRDDVRPLVEELVQRLVVGDV